jgi:two-component system, OmpR family, sensor histidine kinase VanS
MKKFGLGIFGKVFLYTLLFLMLSIGVTGAVFAREFIAAYEFGRRQQAAENFRPFISQLQGKSREEILEIAQAFHDQNPSIMISLQTYDGQTIFRTMGSSNGLQEHQRLVMAVDNNTVLSAVISRSDPRIFEELLYRSGVTFIILILAGTGGAALFAHRMTSPIKRLALTTKKMSNREPVPYPEIHNDEVGQLTRDVHDMYEKLKVTINDLEREIEREKEMEENQRYFFSAASHELKTPIAATSALLEGMLENIGDYQDHPKYLRECLKMMEVQSKLISEIMEIVRLSDGKAKPFPEPLQLKTAVETGLQDLKILSEAREQELVIKIPDWHYCYVDHKMFQRVLINITLNAIQNTPNRARIEIWSEERDGNNIRLCILNSNTQIDEEYLAKLFEPFFRRDHSRSRNQGHSGLGLTIVKKTLDNMGVNFSIENTKEGVLFWVDLPVVEN